MNNRTLAHERDLFDAGEPLGIYPRNGKELAVHIKVLLNDLAAERQNVVDLLHECDMRAKSQMGYNMEVLDLRARLKAAQSERDQLIQENDALGEQNAQLMVELNKQKRCTKPIVLPAYESYSLDVEVGA